jgi:hypothetical protein
MKKNSKPTTPKQPEIQEWDLDQSFGIMPDDISLTQNIGCVGGKKRKETPKKAQKN